MTRVCYIFDGTEVYEGRDDDHYEKLVSEGEVLLSDGSFLDRLGDMPFGNRDTIRTVDAGE